MNLRVMKPYAFFSALNFMVLLGILYLIEKRELPIPYYLTLLIFSISFLLATTLTSERIEDRGRILISSSLLASLSTIFIILLSGGLLYLERLAEWGIEVTASVIALSIISSTIIVTLSFTRTRV